jgi:hypothetical protein
MINNDIFAKNISKSEFDLALVGTDGLSER